MIFTQLFTIALASYALYLGVKEIHKLAHPVDRERTPGEKVIARLTKEKR